MLTTAVIIFSITVLSGPLAPQETKPVPKDSMRVSIPGCSKGYIFTAGRRTQDEPGSVDIPEGMHLRMNGRVTPDRVLPLPWTHLATVAFQPRLQRQRAPALPRSSERLSTLVTG